MNFERSLRCFPYKLELLELAFCLELALAFQCLEVGFPVDDSEISVTHKAPCIDKMADAASL